MLDYNVTCPSLGPNIVLELVKWTRPKITFFQTQIVSSHLLQNNMRLKMRSSHAVRPIHVGQVRYPMFRRLRRQHDFPIFLFQQTVINRIDLRRVDLSVGEGEFLCLLGPTNAGKSTLLKTIAGLHRPDEGRRVWLRGRCAA